MKPREYLIKQDENGAYHLFNIGDEVVRCKNCKWWELVDDYYAKGYGECMCPRSVIKRSTFLNEDWYCADGERKDED